MQPFVVFEQLHGGPLTWFARRDLGGIADRCRRLRAMTPNFMGSELVDEPAQIRVLPVDEQAKMLEARYQEAQDHCAEGERLMREWRPVMVSCRAGLEALNEARESDATRAGLTSPQ